MFVRVHVLDKLLDKLEMNHRANTCDAVTHALTTSP
jgi:hypothetical protein